MRAGKRAKVVGHARRHGLRSAHLGHQTKIRTPKASNRSLWLQQHRAAHYTVVMDLDNLPRRRRPGGRLFRIGYSLLGFAPRARHPTNIKQIVYCHAHLVTRDLSPEVPFHTCLFQVRLATCPSGHPRVDGI